jgi:transposase
VAYFLKNEGNAMQIKEVKAGDLQQLNTKAQRERHAKQRDRYRAVALALEGHKTESIMEMLGRSKNFVQRWSYAYRDGGIEAIAAKRQTGRPTKLPRQKESHLTQRILAGPTEADNGVCVLRGKDVQQILEKEFGVKYTLFGVYDLMHRLGLSCLKPRPRHRKNDPETMQRWLEQAPLLSSTCETKIPTNRSKSGSRMKRESASRER